MKFFQQGLIEKVWAGFDFIFLSVIVIPIEKLIRIDQGLIDHVLIDPVFRYDDALGAKAPPLRHPRLR